MAFTVYKPGQGKYARISAGVLLAALTAYGASALKGSLADTGVLFSIGGQEFTYAQVVPVIVFVVISAVILWGLNYAKFADFLIETEVEMGRVIWPTRRAVIGSSVVVILTLIVMSVVLYAMDQVLMGLLRTVGVY